MLLLKAKCLNLNWLERAKSEAFQNFQNFRGPCESLDSRREHNGQQDVGHLPAAQHKGKCFGIHIDRDSKQDL